MGKLRTFVLSLAFFAYILLDGRLFVQLDTGGRGLLPLLDIGLPLLVIAVAFLPPSRNPDFLRRRRFWLACGVYALLALLYPILGVMSGGYAPRHLMSALEGVLPITFVTLGYLLAVDGPKAGTILRRCLLGAILIQFLYAAVQFAARAGHLSAPFLDQFANWDQVSQLANSGTYLVGRSTGLFINPNQLGFWSVIAFWAGVLLLTGRSRSVAIVAALITLILSQSRGSLVALIGSVGIWFLYETVTLLTVRRSARSRIRGAMVPAVCVLVTLLLLLTLMSSRHGEWTVLAAMQERLRSGLAVLSGGASRDSNLAARLSVWAMVPRFMDAYPLGTLGPPQVLFGAPIDNDYIRLFLQGSVVYLLAVIGMLGYMASLLRARRSDVRFVGIAACAVAINATTALPLTYPSMAVVWVVLGFALAPDSFRKNGRRGTRARTHREREQLQVQLQRSMASRDNGPARAFQSSHAVPSIGA